MSFFQSTDRYRQIFNELKNSKTFGYTNKEIAELTGFDPSKVSRFLNGRRDLNAGEFFYLLESLPEEFQQEFWSRYNPIRSTSIDLARIITDLDLTALGNLLESIGAELKQRAER